MASSMIHIAVANEINKVIKKDEKQLFIGSIAPDIAKHLGQTKNKSHFLDKDDDIPNLSKFLNKYKKYLKDDFVLGYYIHLYTDYLWFKYFVPNFVKNEYVYKINGEKEKVDKDTLYKYIYNDYTNLNVTLIEEYNLNLKIFYEKPPLLDNIISEIPMDKIKVIIEKSSIIIENSKVKKDYIFNLDMVKKFIDESTNEIVANLKDEGIV